MAAKRCSPFESATTVRVEKRQDSTTDGPFAETKEQLGGLYLINAKDLNDAIQVASRIPSRATAASKCGRSWNSKHGSTEARRDTKSRGHEDRNGPSPDEARPSCFRDPVSVRDVVEDIYRAESRRVLATLIRLLGDFDLAEEALHDAFAAARAVAA